MANYFDPSRRLGDGCFQRATLINRASSIETPLLSTPKKKNAMHRYPNPVLNFNTTTKVTTFRRRRRGTHYDLSKFIGCFFVAVAFLWFRVIISFVFILDEEILRNVEPNKTPRQQQRGFHSLPKYPIDHRHINTWLSPRAISQCHKALWHTLETTTTILPNNETFVITGDIPDLWLRDSAAQVHPLLIPNVYTGKSLVQADANLERVVSGLILKTARYIRFDPYANAFKIHDHEEYNQFDREVLGRHGYIATWNYELDSACYFMRMLYFFYVSFPFHPILRMQEVKDAVAIMVDVWIAEQRHEDDAYPNGTLFDCVHCGKPYRYNPSELARGGKGTQTAPMIGLTWSGFRPSDDPCKYGYLIPANMFAVVVLKYMEEMSETVWIDEPLMKKARKLREEIDDGIKRHGVVEHEKYGKIYAFEVDGLGNALLEDDANIPSLLSIPYLGYDYHAEIFANTKRFILSDDNPSFHTGNFDGIEYSGIGSPHTHFIPSSIWPMAMIMEGLISKNSTEKAILVEKLLEASAGTGWMHESFSANNPAQFSRPWFCWPDSLFAELVMSLTEECPTREHGWYGAVKQENIEKIPPPYCGYCYGAAAHEGDCCNTCDDVLAAHKKKGLDVEKARSIAQQCPLEKIPTPYCGYCYGAADHEGDCCNTCEDVLAAHKKLGLDVEKARSIARQCKCGSCYGAHESESDCCNTCDDLLAAYKKKGWDGTNLMQQAEQCMQR